MPLNSSYDDQQQCGRQRPLTAPTAEPRRSASQPQTQDAAHHCRGPKLAGSASAAPRQLPATQDAAVHVQSPSNPGLVQRAAAPRSVRQLRAAQPPKATRKSPRVSNRTGRASRQRDTRQLEIMGRAQSKATRHGMRGGCCDPREVGNRRWNARREFCQVHVPGKTL